ncbi:hypothetical protein [Streptomyces sp. VRA16 Mangrove soil]|uniref:hypothetical protein n=1 Tax=Streptomyces sp. VRA16 Mangrove soil TaxID=2817434 RepID=UPI001A9D04D0|nr:hypothetical protein [Streptomyces sp. VRA16 Mangrove soil]MBO1332601.1 hypothetical protein [Streptomyces sp. VRA16 Mangrove soil]
MVQIERLVDLKPIHQRQAAALALWRWRAPIFAFELDAEWGVDQSVLESLFRLAASPAGEQSDRAYRRVIAELCTAPLFTSEVDPDTVQLFQLETIGNLLTFGELLDKAGVDDVERVVEASAGLATYLDGLVEGSFYSHPAEEAHRQYLADLADQASEGYFASRHFAVEAACHGALEVLPDSAGLLDSSTGRELLALCEDFGEELVTTMQWLRTTGH